MASYWFKPESVSFDLGGRTMTIESGRLAPRAPTVFPLEQAGQVLTDLSERRLAGKAVLLPR